MSTSSFVNETIQTLAHKPDNETNTIWNSSLEKQMSFLDIRLTPGQVYEIKKDDKMNEKSSLDIGEYWYSVTIACSEIGELSVVMRTGKSANDKLQAVKNIDFISCTSGAVVTRQYRVDGLSLYSSEQIYLENHSLGDIKVQTSQFTRQKHRIFAVEQPIIKRNDFLASIRVDQMGKLLTEYERPYVRYPLNNDGEFNILLMSLACILIVGTVILIIRLIVVRSNEEEVPLELIPELLEKETEKRLCGTNYGRYSDGT